MKPQTPHQIAARLTEELRTLYRDHNDGPRLIAEIVASEFPASVGFLTGMLRNPALESEIASLQDELREKELEIEKLEDDIAILRDSDTDED